MNAGSLKVTNETQTYKLNIIKSSSYLTMFALSGLTALFLFAVFSFINTTEAKPNQMATAGLPALHGEAAIAHLKQNGMYDLLAQAVTAARYQVTANEGGATAFNEANGMRLDFTESGWQLKSTTKDKSWSSSWQLNSFGYGSKQTKAAAGAWQTTENRVELARANQRITEWFVNTPNGVEHGFTLAARPDAESSDEALRLVMKVDGDLTAQAERDGQALTLVEGDGAKALRYEKLKVWDAGGTQLAARMRTEASGEVWLEVEEAAAVYPITIDPTFVQEQKITSNDFGGAKNFGFSMAIEGDTAIIGAPRDDLTINGNEGSAFIFVRNGTTWTQQQKLIASDAKANDDFGYSVAISGETVLIGARFVDVSPTSSSQGAVYVFVRNGTTWTEAQKLMASDATPGRGAFGTSVAIEGNTAVVGAETQSATANPTGAAYVFVRSGTTWIEQQKLNASDTAQGDQLFGSSVAISGETIIVGARRYNVGAKVDQGSAYVFVRNGTTWTQQQRLMASDGVARDEFGFSMAISGDTLIIGAPINILGANANNNPGAAYIFVRNGTLWIEQQILIAPDGVAGDEFGNSVAIDGDAAIVGARRDDTSQGSAYIFVRSGTNWTAQPKLIASPRSGTDAFGSGVAISGVTAIIGAPNDDIANGGRIETSQGSAYVFDTPATTLAPIADTWVQGADAFRNTNYGTSPELQVKRTLNPGAGRGRRGFLRFDTSTITGAIFSAKLRIHARLTDASLPPTGMIVQKVTDTAWNELSVTWNNQPAVESPTALASITVTGATSQYYEFDLTSFIQAERAAGRTSVSFRLINQQATGNSGAFYTSVTSREAEGNRPQLVIAQ